MQLTQPLIFFDLETTGVNTAQDRIFQIGAIKIGLDGTREEKNPHSPPPSQSSATLLIARGLAPPLLSLSQ
jgi:DNA polymerase-3 subunit epsilon